MIRDGATITTNQHADVCVVGTGQAGITAAWELYKAGKSVILLDGSRLPEGGVKGYENRDYVTQSYADKKILYGGTADGLFFTNEKEFLILPQYLDQSPSERERAYGGTSTHWGGQCRPLDPVTFERRPGFVGWPIDRSVLDPFYAQASELCHLIGPYEKNGVYGYNFTVEFWAEKEGLTDIPNLDGFDVDMYQFMATDWLNFATRTFTDEKTGVTAQIGAVVDVIVNATLLDINTQNGWVTGLTVASMKAGDDHPQCDTQFTVIADAYVLACGAVANAQRLLLSNLGNDLVGHYFMCQPITNPHDVFATTGNYLSDAQFDLMKYHGALPTVPGYTGKFVANAEVTRANGIGRCWFPPGKQGSSSGAYIEIAPNYASFVGLTAADDVDPVFKQRKTYINWTFDNPDNPGIDKKTWETNCRLFGRASYDYASNKTTIPGDFISCSTPEHSGFLSYCSWDSITDMWVVNGHHIGTTRMSDATEPDKGVVDPNLKMHDLDNLYVAGSSVFPTAGLANPTMTIIALSIRLAQHIAPNVGK